MAGPAGFCSAARQGLPDPTLGVLFHCDLDCIPKNSCEASAVAYDLAAISVTCIRVTPSLSVRVLAPGDKAAEGREARALPQPLKCRACRGGGIRGPSVPAPLDDCDPVRRGRHEHSLLENGDDRIFPGCILLVHIVHIRLCVA